MNGVKINAASISDIHLGHPKNPTSEIIKNLRLAFPDNSETGELDIIFIAGDVFDSLLTLPDDDVIQIESWMAYMITLCARRDIKLRILDGTKSHDWYQSKRFISLAEILQVNVDIKYFDELAIEYMADYDINVLYVPDEWDISTDSTLRQVKELMRAKGLAKVEFAIMHGTFDFQLPEFVKTPKHSSKDYLELVSELIFVGHIHFFSTYDRIISQGSFDRLGQNEEGPKGHVRASVVIGENERYIKFVENKGAKIFKTINCGDLDLDDTLRLIDESVKDLPDGSHVRVSAKHTNPVFTNMNLLVRKYPLLFWTKQALDDEEHEAIQTADEVDTDYVPVYINRDNIKALLIDRTLHATTNSDVIKAADELLNEVIDV